MVDVNWLLVATALAVGILVGLTGVGAGAIMTPALVGFFGVSLPVAVATDLIFATVTKLFGVPFHHRQGSINWVIAKRLWWGSIPGALVGVGLVIFVATKEQTSWLLWPLVAVVLLTSLTLGRRALSADPIRRGEIDNVPSPRWVAPTGGFGIGSAVALTSVGAGALGMALLVRLSPRGINPRELVGTDLVHAIPIALIAGGAYGVAGLVSWPLLLTLLIGSAPGVVFGSLLAPKISARVLNGGLAFVLFSVVVVVVGKGIGYSS